MPTQPNSFLSFDISKMVSVFDPSKMSDEFAKFTGDFNFPAMDIESVMDAQRKNIEVFTTASKAVAEGMQKATTQQAQIMREALDDATKSFGSIENPADAITKQVDLFQKAYEKNVANMTELADIVVKASTEATAATTGPIDTPAKPKLAAKKPKAKKSVEVKTDAVEADKETTSE